MKLLTILLATASIANAAIFLDTRTQFDFSGFTPQIVKDNVGNQISIDFHQFDERTIYMGVFNNLERDQLLTGISFSVTDNIQFNSMIQSTGSSPTGTVEVAPKFFTDQPGRSDVIFDTRNPLTTATQGDNHSGGTEFFIEMTFLEDTTAAELMDSMFFDTYSSIGWDTEDLTIFANVTDYSFTGLDVDDIVDGSHPFDKLYGLTGVPVPEPSAAMLALFGLLPIFRRNRK